MQGSYSKYNNFSFSVELQKSQRYGAGCSNISKNNDVEMENDHSFNPATENQKYLCEFCADWFMDEWLYIAHKELIHQNHDGNNLISSNYPLESDKALHDINIKDYNLNKNNPNCEEETVVCSYSDCLEGAVVRHYKIKNTNKVHLEHFLSLSMTIIQNTLKSELKRLNCIKFNIIMDTIFSNIENETSQRGFIARSRSIIKTSNIKEVVEECVQELILKVTEHEARGSGWSLLQVSSMDVRVHKQGYGDRGSSYIPLPKKISATKACINVQNEDNECFKYAMLMKFAMQDPNAYKVSKIFSEVSHKYNFSGLTYPVALKDLPHFERNNYGVSVNIFGLDDNLNVYPLRISHMELRDHTDLLFLKDGDVSHYVYIKDFAKLVSRQLRKKKRTSLVVCKRCLNYIDKSKQSKPDEWLKEHTRLCGEYSEVRISLPSEHAAILNFKQTNQQYRVPVVVYADFESLLIPVNENQWNKEARVRYQEHMVSSFALVVKSTLDEEHLNFYGLTSKPKVYRGENAAKVFIDELYAIANKVEVLYSYVVPMEDLNEEHVLQHRNATSCYICGESFTEENKKVKDHDHLTGLYRGPACNSCNINYKLPKFIPIVFHNLQKYDSHFIIPELGRDSGRIDVLATTNESFISFSKKVGKIKLKFIDSYKFMASSLMKLTQNLQQSDLIETKKLVPKDKIDLVIRKGIFCYDYIDSFERFSETELPPIDKFYSKLNEEEITTEDYDHACRVWRELHISNLGEYSDFYVKLDVTLLCDVMEEFRNTCFQAYGLDPLHSCTAPGLAWQAMLKETKCKIELLTDIEMVLMVESSIRGGITQSITRHVKANNKHLPDYNPTIESVYLGYFDANNLYGWAMSKPLPHSGFKWVDPCTLDDILTIPENGEKGYILECDIEYPQTLHDHHYDLPLLAKSDIPPGKKQTKLMTTLENKYKYVAHYRIIQQAIVLGLKVTKIHRALQFNQSCWLKPYIDSNTKRRANSKSAFQKDFFKLMNNSIFGKTLENKRKHKNVRLVTDTKVLEKLVAKPNFNTSIIVNEYLVAVSMNKTVVKMDRPIYVGMSILDISKVLMYDFHYNKMVEFYGRDRIGITYMDTDAFLYWIKTDDMYDDLKRFTYKNEFDFSDYPIDHNLYDNGVNKKVLGKFKDETNGVPIKEIVCLAPKMYALEMLKSIDNTTGDLEYIKKAKGVKQNYVKKKITFEHYKQCLKEQKVCSASFNTIRSFNHKLYSVRETKISLSHYDDKRVILQDAIHTLPYGHYSLLQ